MKNATHDSHTPGGEISPDNIPRQSGIFRNAGRLLLWVVGAVVVLVAITVAGISLWLTPQRLTRLVNEEGSKYLNADINAAEIDYTFWSTFPVIHINADSVTITSRSLKGIPDSVRVKLPSDADFLASASHLSGSINIVKALHGEIEMTDLEIGAPKINIVSAGTGINNYSILPPGKRSKPIKRISLGKIHISSPAVVSIFDKPSSTSGKITITGACIKPVPDETGTFSTSLSAIAEGRATGMQLPRPLPVKLDGIASISLHPLNLQLHPDFKIDAADISTRLSLNIAGSKPTVIESLTADISAPDVIKSLEYLPPQLLASLPKIHPLLKSVSPFLPVNLEVSLTKPYPLQPGSQPVFSVSLRIPGAKFSIPLKRKKSIPVENLQMSADIAIDPSRPDNCIANIEKCTMLAAGNVNLSLTGNVRKFLSDNPQITADIDCDADLGSLESRYLPASSVKAQGKVNSSSHIECTLADAGVVTLQSISATGKLKSPSLRISGMPGSARLSADKLDIGYRITGSSLSSSPQGTVTATSSLLKTGGKGWELSADSVSAHLSGMLRQTPFVANASPHTHATSAGDSLLAAKAPHSPIYLIPSLPAGLREFLIMADATASVSAASGKLSTDAYPTRNTFSRLRIYTDLDSLHIYSGRIAADNTEGSLKGSASNLRSFLVSATPANLVADMDIRFANVDINRLCGAYYDGVQIKTGQAPDYSVAPPEKHLPGEAVCIAIPRNISATVRLSSDSAEYMQYRFSPLSTELSVHDGIARIGNLDVGAPYARALLDWTYSTADLDDIFMKISLGVSDFDIAGFMQVFPDLAKEAPELEGTLSAEAEGSFLMFPDMHLNAPSMEARATVKSDSIAVSRSDDKIRHYSHLMLIRGDNPVTITGLDVHGSFHDNFLQVDPFCLSFGGYKVMLAGVNNLQGEIYYHAGLFKSPFHIPFGINIVGNYRHPQIRFGGKQIHDSREREIAADLEDSVDIDIMEQLRYGWLEFVATAAKYDAKNNQKHISDVP